MDQYATIPSEYIGADNQLDFKYFVDETGTPRTHAIAAMREQRDAVPFAYLPYRVPVPTEKTSMNAVSGMNAMSGTPKVRGGTETIAQYTDFLRENSRAPWMRWVEMDRYVYLFADAVDAVAFRLFVDPL